MEKSPTLAPLLKNKLLCLLVFLGFFAGSYVYISPVLINGDYPNNVRKIAPTKSNLAAVGGAFGSNPTLADIPPNTALYLGEYNPAPLEGCYAGSSSIIAQSEMSYDSNNHQMLMFGGGHAATGRTDVDVFNLNTLTWQSAYPPTPYADMVPANFDTSSGGWISTGHPVSRHSWDMMPFAPNVGELVLLGVAAIDGWCRAPAMKDFPYFRNPGKVWHYNPNTKKWRASAYSFPPEAGNLAGGLTYWSTYSATAYDPVSGRIVILSKVGLWTYDPVTETATKLKDHNLPLEIAQNMVYFPPNQKMYYILNNGTVYEVTLDRSNWTNSTVVKVEGITGDPPPLSVPDTTENETGFAYDSEHQIIGGAVLNNTFYAYNPLNKTWTARVMQTNPPNTVIGRMPFHVIDYDPVDKVFIFIAQNITLNGTVLPTHKKYTFAYRYDGGGSATPPPPTPTPDTEAPSVPSGLAAVAVSQTQVNLAWNASTDDVGVTGYRVYRGGSQIATPSGTSYNDTGLSAGTSYSYTVAAYDAAGNVSYQSSSASATTQSPPPSTPSAPPPPTSATGLSVPAVTIPAGVCSDIHSANAKKVTLGTPGAMTLNQARDTLLPFGGGIIEVPSGTYTCDYLYQLRDITKQMDLTIRGIPDANGNKPKFTCLDKSVITFLAIGTPIFTTNATSPPRAPNSHKLLVENIEVEGYNSQVAIHNAGTVILRNNRFHGATGDMIVSTDVFGSQKNDIQICGNEIDHGGQGNTLHNLYIHRGRNSGADTSLKFFNNHCYAANGSHCLKTLANENIIAGNLFESDSVTQGSEVLDIATCTNSIVQGNTFNNYLVNAWIIYFTVRRENDACIPAYGSSEFMSTAFWDSVAAGGLSDQLPNPPSVANPYIFNSFVSGNRFIENRTTKGPAYAIGNAGTYPVAAPYQFASCSLAQEVPSNWVERSRVWVANNTYQGNIRPQKYQPIITSICSGTFVPPLSTGGHIIAVGGEGTAPITLPSWFRTLSVSLLPQSPYPTTSSTKTNQNVQPTNQGTQSNNQSNTSTQNNSNNQASSPQVQSQTQSQSQSTPAAQTTPANTQIANTPSTAPATRVLSRGSTGEDVRRLQRFLINNYYLSSGNDIGVYGPMTEQAVRLFQQAYGIANSGTPATTGYGVVGPVTLLKIKNLGGNISAAPSSAAPAATASATGGITLTKTLYLGVRNSDVLLLQTFLFSKGYITADNATGYFGPITRSAVRKYQCDTGIVCSGNENSTGYGVVGRLTRAKLGGG